jgi:hypothetical protein
VRDAHVRLVDQHDVQQSGLMQVADELRLSWMLWSGEGLYCHMTSWDNVWGMGAYVWLRETSSLLCFDLKVSLVHVFWV